MGREGKADRDPAEVKMNWSTRCFPTPLPISADNTYTSFSPLSLPHARTHLRPHTAMGDLPIVLVCVWEYHWGGKVGHSRVLPHFLGAIICCHSSVARPRGPLSHFSMDNGPHLPPRHPFSPSVCPSVLDHWLTQYCLRLIAKGSRLGAKGLLTLASAVEEGVGSLKGFAECTDSLLH